MEELDSLESSVVTGMNGEFWVNAPKEVTLLFGPFIHFTKNTNLCHCNCKDRLPI